MRDCLVTLGTCWHCLGVESDNFEKYSLFKMKQPSEQIKVLLNDILHAERQVLSVLSDQAAGNIYSSVMSLTSCFPNITLRHAASKKFARLHTWS